MSPPRIAARDIVVARRGVRVLDGACFELHAARLATIEGPSGSGKSTFLRVLALLCEPDEGRVEHEGVDARDASPESFRRKVAYVAQSPAMLDGTVLDNVRAGPAFSGKEMATSKVEALLERVGLGAKMAPRIARELSGGERLRVALARALANGPDVLLLDEPTSALDPVASDRVIALVRSLVGEGVSVVVVTHSREHALSLGGDAFVCSEGKLGKREAT